MGEKMTLLPTLPFSLYHNQRLACSQLLSPCRGDKIDSGMRGCPLWTSSPQSGTKNWASETETESLIENKRPVKKVLATNGNDNGHEGKSRKVKETLTFSLNFLNISPY